MHEGQQKGQEYMERAVIRRRAERSVSVLSLVAFMMDSKLSSARALCTLLAQRGWRGREPPSSRERVPLIDLARDKAQVLPSRNSEFKMTTY